MEHADIIIIGAGIAGLTAAHYLHKAGRDVTILECSDRVGGRMKTDHIDGYTLDHGFQIFLDAYPEAERILNYEDLALGRFRPGANIYTDEGWKFVRDIRDGFKGALKTMQHGPGQMTDYIKILKLKNHFDQQSVEELLKNNTSTTLDYLKDQGFSEKIINTFWKPFYTGIYFDDALSTDAGMFGFTFKMFGKGHATLPVAGMSAIPGQLADPIKHNIHTDTAVHSIQSGHVETSQGTFNAQHIIKAYPSETVDWKSCTTYYFSSDTPIEDPGIIHLCAQENPVLNVVDLSAAQPSYAPEGRYLISTTTLDHHPVSDIQGMLRAIYGSSVDAWQFLRSYQIPQALPRCKSTYSYQPQVAEGMYICGDHCVEGSINGAMRSGRLTAEAILAN